MRLNKMLDPIIMITGPFKSRDYYELGSRALRLLANGNCWAEGENRTRSMVISSALMKDHASIIKFGKILSKLKFVTFSSITALLFIIDNPSGAIDGLLLEARLFDAMQEAKLLGESLVNKTTVK